MKSKKALCATLGPVSDLEKHLPKNWWKKIFNATYLKTDGDVVENPENTAVDVDILIKAAKLQKKEKLLDLCCGQGRHSIELAQRGFLNVSGLDSSDYLIALARKRAKQLKLPICFFKSDARKIKVSDNFFDAVFLMCNSFGYFEKESEDLILLKEIKRVLKNKGKIFLDVTDGVWVKKNFEKRSWEWIDKDQLVCRERSLSKDGQSIISREVVVKGNKGIIADQFYSERLYTFKSLSALLKSIGFTQILAHGNLKTSSSRNQDLGMMENRLFLTATISKKTTKEFL